MAVGTVWTHGHNIEVEFPERLETLQRLSTYARAKGNANTVNWFHFAIPTMSDVQGAEIKLGSVFLRMRCGSLDAFVDSVYIYDGEERIAEFEDLHLNPQVFDTLRLDPPDLLKLTAGLGVSVRVVFGEEDMSHIIEFSSVGAVFTGFGQETQTASPPKPRPAKSRRNRR